MPFATPTVIQCAWSVKTLNKFLARVILIVHLNVQTEKQRANHAEHVQPANIQSVPRMENLSDVFLAKGLTVLIVLFHFYQQKNALMAKTYAYKRIKTLTYKEN
jgi:hypothetical protein